MHWRASCGTRAKAELPREGNCRGARNRPPCKGHRSRSGDQHPYGEKPSQGHLPKAQRAFTIRADQSHGSTFKRRLALVFNTPRFRKKTVLVTVFLHLPKQIPETG